MQTVVCYGPVAGCWEAESERTQSPERSDGQPGRQGINWLVNHSFLQAQNQIVDCQPSKGASS